MLMVRKVVAGTGEEKSKAGIPPPPNVDNDQLLNNRFSLDVEAASAANTLSSARTVTRPESPPFAAEASLYTKKNSFTRFSPTTGHTDFPTLAKPHNIFPNPVLLSGFSREWGDIGVGASLLSPGVCSSRLKPLLLWRVVGGLPVGAPVIAGGGESTMIEIRYQ
ncbi:MAG: hypothetical protein KKE53_20315 [Proteobacteria bacterium]|nr:hypothetical protein [Pseudomonadota bacterium]